MNAEISDPSVELSLVLKARAGDRNAFSLLINSWNKRIYNYALRYLSDHDEASEVAQQVFIKAWKNISRLKNEEQFRSWLYVIAGNTCRDAGRARKRNPVVPLEADSLSIEADASYMHPAKALDVRETGKLLKEAMAKLPDEQKEVLIMKEYEGLKFTEIAVILDEPVNTVKSRLYYALKNMRKHLSHLEKEEI